MIASLSVYISFTIGAFIPQKSFTGNYQGLRKIKIESVINKIQIISLVVFVVFVGKDYLKGGYNEASNVTGMSVIAGIAQQVLMATMLANVVNKVLMIKDVSLIQYIKQYSTLFYIVNLLFFFLVVSSGDRGPMIYMTMMYIGGYFLCSYKKLSFKKAFVGLFIASFFLNVLGSMRSIEQGDFSIDKID